MNYLRSFVWRLARSFRLGGVMLQVHPKSYLRRRGWFRSFRMKRSVDLAANPVPWWSYGVTDFVESRLRESMRVLEFGAGGSTTWLAARTQRVVAVENDPQWAAVVRSFLPANARVVEKTTPGDLVAEDLSGDSAFEVIIVDALANRIDCAKAGLPFLVDNGVVIWDNTDGPDWPEIRALMASHSFREISFSGLAPQEVAEDRTTIFYRRNNVFDI